VNWLSPGPIDFLVLHRLLDDLRYTMPAEELESHIVYLEKKGCVKKETRGAKGFEITMITITAQGLDVIDGFADTRGVDVGF
jgi:hypothetical protein